MLHLSKKFLKQQENDFTLEETKKLQEVIIYHNDLYYNQSSPIISDKEYDDLFKKLKNLENKFSLKL
jgi:DNA ligase (NAD+)